MEKDGLAKSSDISIEKEGYISQNFSKDGIPNQSLAKDHIGVENISVEPYKRKPIPFFEIANEYAKAHIFMVTHTESVGLTMLENSLAGALVVTPVDLVPMDRLETIRHVLTNGSIDWQKVIKMVNPAESAKIAKNNSWQNVARRLYSHLVAFEKTNSY